jgi:hypothetical protein
MEIGEEVLKRRDWLFHLLVPFYNYLIRRPQIDRLRDLLDLPPDGIMIDLGVGQDGCRPIFQDLPLRC